MLVASQFGEGHNLYAPQNWPIFKLWPQMRLMVVVGYRMENACVFFTIFIINKLFLSASARAFLDLTIPHSPAKLVVRGSTGRVDTAIMVFQREDVVYRMSAGHSPGLQMVLVRMRMLPKIGISAVVYHVHTWSTHSTGQMVLHVQNNC